MYNPCIINPLIHILIGYYKLQSGRKQFPIVILSHYNLIENRARGYFAIWWEIQIQMDNQNEYVSIFLENQSMVINAYKNNLKINIFYEKLIEFF